MTLLTIIIASFWAFGLFYRGWLDIRLERVWGAMEIIGGWIVLGDVIVLVCKINSYCVKPAIIGLLYNLMRVI